MLDIKTITEAQSAEIEIRHPITKALLGASVTLAGPEHPKRKSIRFSLQRRVRAQLAKNRTPVRDPEEDDAENIKLLAECTLGWKGIADDGVEIPFSMEAAAELYGRPEMGWLRDQLVTALDDRENFIAGSATS